MSMLAATGLAVPLASPGIAGAAEPADLLLAVHQQENGTNNVTELRCGPAGGDHPRASVACDEITAAGGDFTKLPGDLGSTYCTFEYSPVTVSAIGTWRGQTVEYVETFPNSCVLRSETGSVFTF
ncbi:protease [Lentzea sp. NBRC 105346]|nr:protease [Lentzea sp. NBRC 105346]